MSYLQPVFPLLLILAIIGLKRTWRHSAPGQKPWLLTISIAGIVLLSMNPAAWLLSRPLEIGYNQSPIPDGDVGAIVVLAGAVASPTPSQPYPSIGQDTYIRVEHAVWLFKHWRSRPILVCGGGQDSVSYSETILRLLETEGIPSNQIWSETGSRSTHENAVYGASILRQHGVSRIALVIEARSMSRAASSFSKEGVEVVPAPFRFFNLDLAIEDILPTWRAIESNGETAHELVGLLWYRLRGWI